MIPRRAPTRRAALLELMELDVTVAFHGDCKLEAVLASRWFNQQELVAVGGLRFAARLAEIQREGQYTYDVWATDADAGRYSYRLRMWRDGEERPVSRRSRVKELEARVAELEARLANSEQWLAEAGI